MCGIYWAVPPTHLPSAEKQNIQTPKGFEEPIWETRANDPRSWFQLVEISRQKPRAKPRAAVRRAAQGRVLRAMSAPQEQFGCDPEPGALRSRCRLTARRCRAEGQPPARGVQGQARQRRGRPRYAAI